MKGTLYIVSAPSGAGKSSLLQKVITESQDIMVSVSHTTRAPRPGEIDGESYFFVPRETFEAQIEAGDFLEYAEVFGNFYGTSGSSVETFLEEGKDVILEIDWQGARIIRESYEDTVSIFIRPPNLESLQQRLENRKQDSDEVIQGRMCEACNEMSHYSEYDYLIINDDFDQAARELNSIFLTERTRLKRQCAHHGSLLEALLQKAD